MYGYVIYIYAQYCATHSRLTGTSLQVHVVFLNLHAFFGLLADTSSIVCYLLLLVACIPVFWLLYPSSISIPNTENTESWPSRLRNSSVGWSWFSGGGSDLTSAPLSQLGFRTASRSGALSSFSPWCPEIAGHPPFLDKATNYIILIKYNYIIYYTHTILGISHENPSISPRFGGFLVDSTISSHQIHEISTFYNVLVPKVIDVDEFTKRCMSLRGPARSMDVFAVIRHNLKIREQLQSLRMCEGGGK